MQIGVEIAILAIVVAGMARAGFELRKNKVKKQKELKKLV